MFSGLFFIIVLLLIITLSPEGVALTFINAPLAALIVALASYGLLLIVIYYTSRAATFWIRRHKTVSFTLINLLLLSYLLLFHFVLGASRILPNASLNAMLSLSLYFGGLATYNAGSFYRRYLFPGCESQTPLSYTTNQLRMWVPFVLPFLFFTVIYDVLLFVPDTPFTNFLFVQDNDPTAFFIFLMFTGCLIFLILAFLPFFIQKMWLCEEIEDTETWLRLVKICNHANFKCKGLRLWTVMNQFHTAAIIGILPKFRYVMFTKRLLHELPKESIDAILIHEIGHSYRKHLLLTPLIMLGMFITAGVFSLLFFDTFEHLFVQLNSSYPSIIWSFLSPVALLLFYIALLWLYFRFVFGFFSRLFERQADLHGYEVGATPKAMIDALDQIGIVTGNTHEHPNWHHHSLADRISFLYDTIEEPELVQKHHNSVKICVTLYLFLFTLGCLLLFAEPLQELPFFYEIHQITQSISQWIKKAIWRLP